MIIYERTLKIWHNSGIVDKNQIHEREKNAVSITPPPIIRRHPIVANDIYICCYSTLRLRVLGEAATHNPCPSLIALL